jgi:hypothetical protein
MAAKGRKKEHKAQNYPVSALHILRFRQLDLESHCMLLVFRRGAPPGCGFGEAFTEERADLLVGLRRSAQLARGSQKAVRHAFPDIRLRIHSGRQSTVDTTDRVIEQHFVVTDVDANRLEAG